MDQTLPKPAGAAGARFLESGHLPGIVGAPGQDILRGLGLVTGHESGQTFAPAPAHEK